MSLLKTLKANSLTARKAKDSITSSLLITLIGDIEIIGKNDGNRASTDVECISVIKKFIKNNQEILQYAEKDSDTWNAAIKENSILSGYLPKQFTDTELGEIIDTIINNRELTSPKEMGIVMKQLKSQFAGQFDGKIASKIAREKLNG